MNDRAKTKILARRARFLAAAIAGAGLNVAACSEAQACLSQTNLEDTRPEADASDAADSEPVPCLGVPYDGTVEDTTDATTDAETDGG